jgi:hypothetical protein
MTVAVVVLIIIVVAGIIATSLVRAHARQREQLQAERRRRGKFIRAYVFPAALAERICEEHPDVSPDDVPVVLDGLREFFLACLSAEDGGIARNVGMPSKIVDDAWHEFLLMTREYHALHARSRAERRRWLSLRRPGSERARAPTARNRRWWRQRRRRQWLRRRDGRWRQQLRPWRLWRQQRLWRWRLRGWRRLRGQLGPVHGPCRYTGASSSSLGSP